MIVLIICFVLGFVLSEVSHYIGYRRGYLQRQIDEIREGREYNP